jgi:peptide/nickel transport system substrate-binding protein
LFLQILSIYIDNKIRSEIKAFIKIKRGYKDMKKKNLLFVAFLVLVPFLILSTAPQNAASSSQSVTSNAAPSTQSVISAAAPPTQQKTSTTTPSTSASSVQKGGILRVITGGISANMGNPGVPLGPKPTYLACIENLATFDSKGNLVPVLAASWDVDVANKKITYHLRQGVKFHDATDFDAAAVKWNIEQYLASNQLSAGQYITAVDAVDKYTIRVTLKQYSPLFLTSISQAVFIFSPTSVQTLGKDASLTHPVGTGPFKFSDFRRDAFVKYVRNDNYWKPGLANLDGITFTVVPDTVTASTTMLAKQADMWFTDNGIPVKEATNLQKKGLGLNVIQNWYFTLTPDSVNADSPYAKKEVREAIECAIDRPALAKVFGLGLSEPLTQTAPSSREYGYNPDYAGRPYDVAKAKQLLNAAGYSQGLKTKIIIQNLSAHRDIATAVQGYLAAVGIDAQIDVADNARYQGYFAGKSTWNNALVLMIQQGNPGLSYIESYLRLFRPGGRYASLLRSSEFEAICKKITGTTDPDEIKTLGKQLIKQAADDAMLTPLMTNPQPIVFQSYVHTGYGTIDVPPVWYTENDWMEKH